MPPNPIHSRPAIANLSSSLIREVANAAMGRADVLAFWFGEPDSVTPGFIRDAAQRALARGDTFYHHNLGMAELRHGIARYVAQLHGACDASRVCVTSSGVNALMLAAQLLLSPGDNVVVITPVWPNLLAIPQILGAQVQTVPLRMDDHGTWALNLDELISAITPSTRLVIVNSPNNPTGWIMPAAQINAVRAHCSVTGTWILSDEAYERIVFDGGQAAPSFLDRADPGERLLVANTFSKAWQMTGWRLGWLVAPEAVMPDLGKLIEFNTSCAPGFVQHAALAAVTEGEDAVGTFVATLKGRRDVLIDALSAIEGVSIAQPPGAMYAFLRVDGLSDSLQAARSLVHDHGLGLAPGAAFGTPGEGCLRWCFARDPVQLVDGARRMAEWMARRKQEVS